MKCCGSVIKMHQKDREETRNNSHRVLVEKKSVERGYSEVLNNLPKRFGDQEKVPACITPLSRRKSKRKGGIIEEFGLKVRIWLHGKNGGCHELFHSRANDRERRGGKEDR